jgi:TonB family protein
LDNNSDKAKRFILWSLIVSLFVHIGVLGFIKLSDLNSFKSVQNKKKEKRLRVVLQQRNSKPKQIVTSEESKKKERDPKAKFLSKNTQKFDRQMTARNTGSFKAAGKGQKNGKKPQRPQKAVKKMTAVSKTPSKSVQQKKGRKSKKKISFADLAVGRQVPQAKPKKKRAAASMAALGLKNGLKDKTGLSANNDFVEDVPLGDMTKLNTVEYKYYGFYHRIKQKLEQYWGNSIQQKAKRLWKTGRRLASNENRITSLQITLDDKGNIVRINVKGSSGVQELDEAAVESFNKAGPFPNPPSGMMKNGLAVIEWGFVVKS